MRMQTDAQTGVKPPGTRRNFTLFFILVIGICAVVTFVVFRSYARSSIDQRREVNRANLSLIAAALKARAMEGQLPSTLARDAVATHVLINPSWPEQAGYMYVTGARLSDPAETILLFENTPAQKQKLGRHALRMDGRVEVLAETALQEKLAQQQNFWVEQKRVWRLNALSAEP